MTLRIVPVAACLFLMCAGTVGASHPPPAVHVLSSMLSHAVSWWTVPRLLDYGTYLLDTEGSAKLAQHYLAAACDLDPANPAAHFALARLLQTRTSNVEWACAAYERVLDLDCEHTGAMCNYGLLLHTHPLEQWDDAEELYERVLALHPRHPTALANYGLLQSVRDDGKGGSASADFLFDEAVGGAGRDPVGKYDFELGGLVS